MRRREIVRRADGALRLAGVYFETDYADFVAWRDFGHPGEPVENCFSMAALRSADGAFLLGEMAAHTVNAGRIYFPAGTPDLQRRVRRQGRPRRQRAAGASGGDRRLGRRGDDPAGVDRRLRRTSASPA